jgi:hypothetical protein
MKRPSTILSKPAWARGGSYDVEHIPTGRLPARSLRIAADRDRKVHARRLQEVRPKAAGRQNCLLFQEDHSLAYCDGEEWKIPAPETWEAIRKAATTAGTLMSLRNWSTDSMFVVPPTIFNS